MSFIRASGDALDVDILVQPRASRARIGPIHDDRIKVAVTTPPVDGAANASVVAMWAKALHVPKGAVEVVKGQSSRRKTLRIRGASEALVRELLA